MPYNYANFFHSFFVWVFLQFYMAGILRLFKEDVRGIQSESSGAIIFLLALDFLIALLNLMIYGIVILNSCLCYLDINPDSRDHMAGNMPEYKRILVAVRVFTILLETYLESDYYLTLYIVNMILSGLIIMTALSYNLSYNVTIVKIKLVILSFNVILCIGCVILRASKTTSVMVDPVILASLLSPFLSKALIMYKENQDYRMYKFFDKKVGPDEIVTCISMLLFTLGHNNATQEFTYFHTALIGHHRVACKNSSCFCKMYIKMKIEKYSAPLKLKGLKAFNQTEAKVISLVESLFEYYIDKYPKHHYLNLTYSYFLMNFVGNILKSINYLILSREKASGPTKKYFVQKQMYDVSHYMNEVNNDLNDPTNRLELPKAVEINESFDAMLVVFEKALFKNSQFFASLSSDHVNQTRLLEEINEIHSLNGDINRLFSRIYTETTHHLGSLMVYGLFQKLILNTIESNTTLAKAEELKAHVLHKNYTKQILEKIDDLLVLDAALLTVSAQKMRYGKVVYANKSLCNQFGYFLNEIINENIIRIIPNIIAGNHDKYMRDFENRGGGQFFKKVRKLFGKHKQGYIIPIQVLAKPVFNAESGLEYIGLIRSINDISEYVLTSQSGIIDSMTIGLMHELRLTPFLLNADPLHVERIVKNAKRYYDRIGDRPTTTMVDREEGIEDFKLKLETELIISQDLAKKSIEKILRRQEKKDKEARKYRRESAGSDNSYTEVDSPKNGRRNSNNDKEKEKEKPLIRPRKQSMDVPLVRSRKDSVDVTPMRRRKESADFIPSLFSPPKIPRSQAPSKKISSIASSKASTDNEGLNQMIMPVPAQGRRGSKLFINTNPIRRGSGATLSFGDASSPTKIVSSIQKLMKGSDEFNKESKDMEERSSNRTKRSGHDTNSPSLKRKWSVRSFEDVDLPCLCTFDRVNFQHSRDVYIVVELTNIETNQNVSVLKTKSRITSITKSFIDLDSSDQVKNTDQMVIYKDLENMRDINYQNMRSGGSSIHSLDHNQDVQARHIYLNRYLAEFNLGKVHSIFAWTIWIVFFGLYFLLRANLQHVDDLIDEFNDRLNIIGMYLPSRTYPFQLASNFYVIEALRNGNISDLGSYSNESNVYLYPESYLREFFLESTLAFEQVVEQTTLIPATYDNSEISSIISDTLLISDEGVSHKITYYLLMQLLFQKVEALDPSLVSEYSRIIRNLHNLTQSVFMDTNSTFNQLVKTTYTDVASIISKPYLLGVVNPSIIAEIVLFLFVFLLMSNVIRKNQLTFKSMLLLRPHCPKIHSDRLNSLNKFYMIKREINTSNTLSRSGTIQTKTNSKINTPIKNPIKTTPLKTPQQAELIITERKKTRSFSRRFFKVPKVKLFNREFFISVFGSLCILVLNIILNIAFVTKTAGLSSDFRQSLNIQINIADHYFLMTNLISHEVSFIIFNKSSRENVKFFYDSLLYMSGIVEQSRQNLINLQPEIRNLFQGDLCDALISSDEEAFLNYCNRVYETTATEGFWLYESSLMKDLSDIQVNITSNKSVVLTSTMQKKVFDMVFSNNFITYRVINTIWADLVRYSRETKDQVTTDSLQFSVVDIVLITIFFIYNAVMMRKLSKLGHKVKIALRFFPDDILLKDKNVLSYISETSSDSGYGSLLKKKNYNQKSS